MQIKYVGNKNTYGLAVVKILIFGALLLPLFMSSPNATAEPPIENNCISYAYTESVDHYFLLETNKSAFGNNLTIEHNCQYIEVWINGTFQAYTENNKITFPIELGINNIELKSENYSKNITNVLIYPDRLAWEFQYFEWQDSKFDYSIEDYISISKATAQQNWASILSIVMVFTLTTMVYWNLINSYIDRNFCEEVKT